MKIRKVSADRLDAPRPMRRGSTDAGASTAGEADHATEVEMRDGDDRDAGDEITRPTNQYGQQASATAV